MLVCVGKTLASRRGSKSLRVGFNMRFAHVIKSRRCSAGFLWKLSSQQGQLFSQNQKKGRAIHRQKRSLLSAQTPRQAVPDVGKRAQSRSNEALNLCERNWNYAALRMDARAKPDFEPRSFAVHGFFEVGLRHPEPN